MEIFYLLLIIWACLGLAAASNDFLPEGPIGAFLAGPIIWIVLFYVYFIEK